MRDQDGKTALMWAADKTRAQCVTALLAADGIDMNVQTTVRHSVDNHTCHALHCVHARPASCRLACTVC